jgi:hypothetical protein
MTLCSYGTKLTREGLARVATPAATATHKPIPHAAVVENRSDDCPWKLPPQVGAAVTATGCVRNTNPPTSGSR